MISLRMQGSLLVPRFAKQYLAAQLCNLPTALWVTLLSYNKWTGLGKRWVASVQLNLLMWCKAYTLPDDLPAPMHFTNLWNRLQNKYHLKLKFNIMFCFTLSLRLNTGWDAKHFRHAAWKNVIASGSQWLLR